MIPVLKYLSRTNRRLWERSVFTPFYIGTFKLEAHGAPRLHHGWIGRHPRTYEWILFVSRRLNHGGCAASAWTGMELRQINELTKKVIDHKRRCFMRSIN